MSAYLPICGAVVTAIALAWVARSIHRRIATHQREQQLNELQRESWARTLDRLQLETAERWRRAGEVKVRARERR